MAAYALLFAASGVLYAMGGLTIGLIPHAFYAGRAARPASRHTSDCAAIGALIPKA